MENYTAMIPAAIAAFKGLNYVSAPTLKRYVKNLLEHFKAWPEIQDEMLSVPPQND